MRISLTFGTRLQRLATARVSNSEQNPSVTEFLTDVITFDGSLLAVGAPGSNKVLVLEYSASVPKWTDTRTRGSVITWGSRDHGGDCGMCSRVQARVRRQSHRSLLPAAHAGETKRGSAGRRVGMRRTVAPDADRSTAVAPV